MFKEHDALHTLSEDKTTHYFDDTWDLDTCDGIIEFHVNKFH